MVNWISETVGASAVLFMSVGLCLAEPLAQPAGPVILTVAGGISGANTEEGAVFDLAMLEAIGIEKVVTKTIWTEGEHTFEGVSLAALLETLAAEGNTLRMTALNEYAVDMPRTEAVTGGPILAYRMDGVELSPRDKGPLWVIYPFDSKPEYQNEVSYSRSVWQLNRLDVLP